MNGSEAKKIRFWCEVALSILTAVVAVLFIAEVADIYYSAEDGADIYTRAIVGKRLKAMIAPAVIWVAGIIACFVLSAIYPTAVKKPFKVSRIDKVKNLKKRLPVGEGEEYLSAYKKYSRFELWRIIAYGVASAFSVATAVIIIVYLSKTANFKSGDIKSDIFTMFKKLLPWVAASFLLFIGCIIYEFSTANQEISSMKNMIIAAKGAPIITSPLTEFIVKVKNALEQSEAITLWVARGVVFAVSVAFIALGINNGGVTDVLNKAVAICTECIGLG